MELKLDNRSLAVTSEGFLCDWNDWDEAVARVIAKLNGMELTSAHWEIILFMRRYYQNFKHLPNSRLFTKAIAHEFGTEKGNSRYLHQLFPHGPLKYTCKIAGLPKPPTCL